MSFHTTIFFQVEMSNRQLDMEIGILACGMQCIPETQRLKNLPASYLLLNRKAATQWADENSMWLDLTSRGSGIQAGSGSGSLVKAALKL